MADDADIADEEMQRVLERSIANTRADILPGREGECDLCGEYSGRLINGACAPCRDRYGLD